MRLIRCYKTLFSVDVDLSNLEEVSSGDCDIKSFKINEEKSCELISIVAILLDEPPELNERGCIKVPESLSREGERVLEFLINSLSVIYRSNRSIYSLMPSVGFVPENEEESAWLEASNGIEDIMDGIAEGIPEQAASLDTLKLFSDRPDGVALIAESNSNSNNMGKYRDLIRFFECAFKLPVNQLSKKLNQFLEPNGLGYSRAEIDKWVSYRDGASHADYAKNEEVFLESDILRITPRMLQAAYDVLYNKENWRDSGRNRRDSWKPTVGTTNPSTNLLTTQGKDAKFRLQRFEVFGSYPIDFTMDIREMLPQNIYWTRGNRKTSKQ